MADIFLCSDRNNVVGLAATVRSALDASSVQLNIHVLHHGIGTQHQAELMSSWRHSRCGLVSFIPLNFSAVSQFRPTMYLTSRMAYARIYVAEALSPEIKRAIYLDTDLLVYGDLAELDAMNLDGKTVAACKDISVRISSAAETAKELEARLNLRDGLWYFNSGVIVIDMHRWRETQVQQKCMSLGVKLMHKLHAQDQDLLNIVLEGDWKELDVYWNRSQYEAAPETREGIIHLIGRAKPWHDDYAYHFSDAFFEWVDRTSYRGYRPRGDGSGFYARLAAFRRRIPTLAVVGNKLKRLWSRQGF